MIYNGCFSEWINNNDNLFSTNNNTTILDNLFLFQWGKSTTFVIWLDWVYGFNIKDGNFRNSWGFDDWSVLDFKNLVFEFQSISINFDFFFTVHFEVDCWSGIGWSWSIWGSLEPFTNARKVLWQHFKQVSTESRANHAIEDEVYGGIDNEKSVADLKIFNE